MGDVDADPRTLECLRGGDRRPTSAERVEYDVALVATGLDDPLQQGFRFLRRIAEALLRSGVEGWDVRPHVTESLAPLFIQVSLEPRHGAWTRLYYESGIVCLLHALLRPAPHTFTPRNLYMRFGRSAFELIRLVSW